jgi:hypothetical protein
MNPKIIANPEKIQSSYETRFSAFPIEKSYADWTEDEKESYRDFKWDLNNFPLRVARLLWKYDSEEKDNTPIRTLERVSDEAYAKSIKEGIHSEKYYNGTRNDFNKDIMKALIECKIDIDDLKQKLEVRSEANSILSDRMNELVGDGTRVGHRADEKFFNDVQDANTKVLSVLVPVFSHLIDKGYTQFELAG